ncbi:very long chain fatty acid elongase 7-like [Musca autumnalis]|uniref:very long chain fatty acid elongase 7-like n=1 Tax=Musca autumnalis TaxID=221902 RepID=UPI003CED8CFB
MLIFPRLEVILAQHYKRGIKPDAPYVEYPEIGHQIAVFDVILVFNLILRLIIGQNVARKGEKSFKIHMQCYNILQILLNLYVFVGSLSNCLSYSQFNWTCTKLDVNDVSPITLNLRKFTFLYFFTKFLDIFDLVFLVLNKQRDNVTKFHKGQHLINFYGAFVYQRHIYGGQLAAVGFINIIAQIFVHCYHFWTAGKENSAKVESWKRYLVQIQILQFSLTSMSILLTLLNNSCGFPDMWLAILLVLNLYAAGGLYRHYVKEFSQNVK